MRFREIRGFHSSSFIFHGVASILNESCSAATEVISRHGQDDTLKAHNDFSEPVMNVNENVISIEAVEVILRQK